MVVGNALPSPAHAATPAAAPGLLANVVAPASYPAYGTPLIAGCAWATWVANCGNLTVYSNGGQFDNVGCGAPNGCKYGEEVQCTELAQRYAAYAWGEPDDWSGIGGSTGDAAQMWKAGPALPVPLAQFPNGGATAPHQGDILVFAPGWIGSYWDAPGHVAVISGVGSNYVNIVEENGTASGSDRFVLNGSTIAQPSGYTPIIGWMRPEKWVGPIDLTAQWGAGFANSTPTVVANGPQRLIFWQGSNNHLWEAWYTPGIGWAGPIDWTAQWGGGLITSPPTVLFNPEGQTLIFWRGQSNHLFEAWYTPGTGWAGPVDWSVQWGVGGVQSQPTVVISPQDQTLVFWNGTNGQLLEAWYTMGAGWAGPVNWTAQWGGGAPLASQPTMTITPSQVLIFWRGADNALWEAWYTYGTGWAGPVNWTATLGGDRLGSAPTVVPASNQMLIFW
ncbi:MAG: CHAP domain-containing protein, partial [Streptomyces sp.]|nr:CHAP domain-containing protein [Streptomyces sp.]